MNDFSVMLSLLHKSTPVPKESVHVCIETTAQPLCWLNLPFYDTMNLFYFRVIEGDFGWNKWMVLVDNTFCKGGSD